MSEATYWSEVSAADVCLIAAIILTVIVIIFEIIEKHDG